MTNAVNANRKISATRYPSEREREREGGRGKRLLRIYESPRRDENEGSLIRDVRGFQEYRCYRLPAGGLPVKTTKAAEPFVKRKKRHEIEYAAAKLHPRLFLRQLSAGRGISEGIFDSAIRERERERQVAFTPLGSARTRVTLSFFPSRQ